ncbi:hypothetical protein A2U01_0014637, partial [Trifolium medium]|nr:hypothetical protein [Trifolium medium]
IMEYNFKAKNDKELKRANSAMQQKASGSVMCLYIYNTANDAVKNYLEKKAAEMASNNGYTLTLLNEDPGDI